MSRHVPFDPAAIGAGALSMAAGQAIAAALGPRAPAIAALRALHLALFWTLAAYVYASHVPLDAAVLAANVEWPPSAGALRVLRAGLHGPTLAVALAAVGLAALHDARRATRLRGPHPALAVPLSAAWLGLALVPGDTFDEVARAARSTVDHARQTSAICGPLPLRDARPDAPAAAGATVRPRRTPDIVLIAIESLHAAFLDRRDARGRPIVPALESLRERGLSVDRFYAHSVQTAKGHFSLLTSMAPALAGVEFERYPALPVQTLPGVLRQLGYETVFVQGQSDPDFDNTRGWLLAHGVDRHEVAAAHLTPDERRAMAAPWGTTDEGTYLAAERLAGARARAGAPLLLMVATVESHQPFDGAPGPDPAFQTPRGLGERYANAMRTADRALGGFLARTAQGPLADALLVVTGDHAFPLGEHGLEHNEAGAFEEFFRVPLVLVDPADARPTRLAGPFGQVDVAPTLLDRLGVAPPSTFQGRVMTAGAGARPVPLVQPYAGVYVGATDGRLKYLRHLRTAHEALFDLRADPAETRNLLERPAPPAVPALAGTVAWLVRHHCAMEAGRPGA